MLPLDRRTFIKATGGLMVSFAIAHAQTSSAAEASIGRKISKSEVDGFIAIAKNGHVTLYVGKVDMGTGVRTALGQIAADELDIPMDRLTVICGDTKLTPDQGQTVGSQTIELAGPEVRLAAATARQTLLALASKQLRVPVELLSTENGEVRSTSGNQKVRYAALIGDRNFSVPVDKNVRTKNPADYRLVGKSVSRVDIRDKVSAAYSYVQDVRVPGMLHGRVIHPTAIGAHVEGVDESSVQHIPGIVKVVRISDFVGVVALTEWGAIRATQALKVTWTGGGGLPGNEGLYEAVRNSPRAKEEVAKKTGDVDGALKTAAQSLKATYQFPMQTHGSLGPSCAVADVRQDQATIWSATQGPYELREQLAQMLGLDQEKVRVVYHEGSGSYGRNGAEDAASDAAILSRAIGKPVRVQWMRHDEHGWDPKGPPCIIDLEGGLDADGNIVAWHSEFWMLNRIPGSVPMLGASLAGLPQPDGFLEPGGVQGNAVPLYEIPNVRVLLHRLSQPIIRSSPIRSPGKVQNMFANECFMDELAAAAGADPLEFRLRTLSDKRGRAVLNKAAEIAGWTPRPSRRDRTAPVAEGRGLAYIGYGDGRRARVAAIADVTVDRNSGEIRVRRVVVVHDCGLIINPDGVKNQVEGSVIQTLSRTLKEELIFDRDRVTSTDWLSYPILTFPDIPEVEVHLIDQPNEPAVGAGEPTASIIPAMVGNAVFDAIGVRLRTAPFTPERVKAAT